MREQLEQRLKELGAEFEAGQKTLAELEARQTNIRETLLRISGAIQVLEEELDKATQAGPKVKAQLEPSEDGQANPELDPSQAA